MKISQYFAGAYFSASDVPCPRTLVIREVKHETMRDGEAKLVMSFFKESQSLVLNKTNAFTCIDHFGDDAASWGGKLVELYSTKTDFGGRLVPCIRLRIPDSQDMVAEGAQPSVLPPAIDYPVDA